MTNSSSPTQAQLILAGLLQALKGKKVGAGFSMGKYCQTLAGEPLRQNPKRYAKNFCGTSHCLAGLIPSIDPKFAAGFLTASGNYDYSGMSFSLLQELSMSVSRSDVELHWTWLFGGCWDCDDQEGDQDFARTDAIFRLEFFIRSGYAIPAAFSRHPLCEAPDPHIYLYDLDLSL